MADNEIEIGTGSLNQAEQVLYRIAERMDDIQLAYEKIARSTQQMMRNGIDSRMPLPGTPASRSLLDNVSAFTGLSKTTLTVTGALAAFEEMVRRSAHQMRDMALASQQSGGTIGNVQALQGMGLAVTQIAATARSFRESISVGGGDIFAMMAASRAGVSPQVPRRFGGTMNEAQLLEDFIRGVARLTSYEERLLTVRQAGREDLIGQIEMYRRIGPLIEADTRAREALVPPDAIAAAQRLGDQQTRLKNQWDALAQALSTPAIELTTEGLKALNWAIGEIGKQADRVGHPQFEGRPGFARGEAQLAALRYQMQHHMLDQNDMGRGRQQWESILEDKARKFGLSPEEEGWQKQLKAWDAQGGALQGNTEALHRVADSVDRNTAASDRALRTYAPGSFGKGGPRTASLAGTPEIFNEVTRQLLGRAVRMGAATFG